ncbi:MAG: DUF3085 domain-containing protein [PVC group bacterium]|nr:DUF3085 domain-containing protein [PVC group bacterium]
MSKTILNFNLDEVKNLVTGLSIDAEIFLVGDQGVYLMCFDQPAEKRKIVYAKGINPAKDDDWWEEKRAVYGGDDGGDTIATVRELACMTGFTTGKLLKVYLTPTTIETKIGS